MNDATDQNRIVKIACPGVGGLSLFCIFLITLVANFFLPPVAEAQFFATCETASPEELRRSIAGHNEHVARLNRKFRHYWYFQGTVDAEQFRLDLEEVREFLQQFDRKTAVLFYAHNPVDSRLCTWLLSTDERSPLVSHVSRLDNVQLASLQRSVVDGMGITRRAANRAPAQRGVQLASGDRDAPADAREQAANAGAALKMAGEILLPPPVSSAIADHVETLIVVPMTVIYGTEIFDDDGNDVIASETPTTSIGTLPFAALPVGDRQLIDIVSIVVSPGFMAFKIPPLAARRQFRAPVIAGNPAGRKDADWDFPPLPGAAAEAQEIAGQLGRGSPPLTGESVTIEAIVNAIQPDTGLIHLATHGIADPVNPLDGSFLWLNGRWSAREISQQRLAGRPLVVLSACQTGLGKDFAVGTTGLARAWMQAGASSVVMSLWNVDDSATRDLMTHFISEATRQPVDRAMRTAMLRARDAVADPYYWAGFTTFGVPELPH